MKTTGLFTTHRQEIEVSLGKPFRIIPFGDVHRDSDMFANDYWEDFLAYAKKQKNAVFLGMGDYVDGISTSERIVLSNMHDTTKTRMGQESETTADLLAKELSFMKGRVIGLIGGNHYFQYNNGDTTDHILAAKLGTKFLGVCSFIRLSLRVKERSGTRLSFDILAHHGLGGGKLAGSVFNRVEDMMRTAHADLYLMGHNHTKGCVPAAPRLLPVKGSKEDLIIREHVPWLGRTGSFLKAYEDGRASYNVDAGRSPVALGWIEFEVTPRRTTAGGQDWIYLHVRGTA